MRATGSARPALKLISPLLSLILVFTFLSPAQAQTGLECLSRWCTYNGQPIYFIGFDTQELASDPTINYVDALDQFVQQGVNKTRIWLYTWFGTTSFGALTPWARDANGDHDLDTWDPAYWQRVRDFIAAAQARNIIVEVTIFSEYPAPSDYIWNDPSLKLAWNKVFNQNNAFTSNRFEHFYPEFFDSAYTETSSRGKTVADYQKDLIDKAVLELGSFPNVYFEIHNEFPAVWNVEDIHPIDRVFGWQRDRADYLKQITSRPVSAQSHEGGGAHTYGTSYFANWPTINFLTFHFNLAGNNLPNKSADADPNLISSLLNPYQLAGKALQVNESLNFHIDLDGQTRYGWGMFMSGGYFTFYEDDSSRIGSDGWIAGAKRLKAIKDIANKLKFWELSPVDASGNEYDSLISGGPALDWQVMAKPGSEYIAYFWGTPSSTPVSLQAPTGNYNYEWYDAQNAALINSGSFSSGSTIPAPPTSSWNGSVGLALVIKRSGTGGAGSVPIAHWQLDDGSGTVASDASGNGNTGTLINGPTWTTGRIGGALSFDGVNDYVVVPHNDALNAPALTVAGWVNIGSQDATNYRVLWQKLQVNDSNGYFLILHPTGDATPSRLEWSLADGGAYYSVFSSTALANNSWYHVAVTFSGSTSKIYVNGNLESTNTAASKGTTTDPFYLGIEDGGCCGALNGLLDDVRVYNRELSTAEIQALSSGN